jgi:hypothetical protein
MLLNTREINILTRGLMDEHAFLQNQHAIRHLQGEAQHLFRDHQGNPQIALDLHQYLRDLLDDEG